MLEIHVKWGGNLPQTRNPPGHFLWAFLTDINHKPVVRQRLSTGFSVQLCWRQAGEAAFRAVFACLFPWQPFWAALSAVEGDQVLAVKTLESPWLIAVLWHQTNCPIGLFVLSKGIVKSQVNFKEILLYSLIVSPFYGDVVFRKLDTALRPWLSLAFAEDESPAFRPKTSCFFPGNVTEVTRAKAIATGLYM